MGPNLESLLTRNETFNASLHKKYQRYMDEGYHLSGEYACSDECAIALCDGDEAQLRKDLEDEEYECGATDCYWSYWWDEIKKI